MALQPPQTAEQLDLPSAPPPSSSSSLCSNSQRLIPTPFLIKTYQLVDDVSVEGIVSWSDEGKGFVVWNPAAFARDVLPKLFKHNNFSSFVQQLYTYGFRKIMPDRWEFSHECFQKGDKRRKLASVSAAAVIPGASALSVATIPAGLMDPSTSNSGEGRVYSWNSAAAQSTQSAPLTALLFADHGNESSGSRQAHLVDENYQLKKTNTQLLKELGQMKSMCTILFSMMYNYNPGSGLVPGLGSGPGPPPLLVGCGSGISSQAESMMIPLHLMSMPKLLAAVVETQTGKASAIPELLSSNPSLSSFQHSAKRARGVDGSVGEPVEQDDLLQLQQPSR